MTTTTRHREPFTIALRFTADVIEPDPPCVMADIPNDCQCTNVYGEPTEHGYGQTLTSGWHNPNWSMDNVQDEPNRPRVLRLHRPGRMGRPRRSHRRPDPASRRRT